MKKLRSSILVSAALLLLGMALTLATNSYSNTKGGQTLVSDMPDILSASFDDDVEVAHDLPPIESASFDDGVEVAHDLPPIESA